MIRVVLSDEFLVFRKKGLEKGSLSIRKLGGFVGGGGTHEYEVELSGDKNGDSGWRRGKFWASTASS